MLSIEEEKMMRRIIADDGLIDPCGFGGIYPVYPRGNRRRKPISWVDMNRVKAWRASGWLTPCGNMFALSPDFVHRFTVGRFEASLNREKQEAVPQPHYSQSGKKKEPELNSRSSVLQRLGRRRGRNGRPMISAAQIEAGTHFARDYSIGGMGLVVSQNFESLRVDGTSKAGGQENAVISGIDRRRRIGEAISCLGPDLDRALIAVCCDNWSLERLERSEKWAKNSGLTVLTLGLDRLVKFYGTEPGL